MSLCEGIGPLYRGAAAASPARVEKQPVAPLKLGPPGRNCFATVTFRTALCA